VNLDRADLQEVSRLWDELSEFPASRSGDARTHCLTSLARMTGASGAFWVGASRGDDWSETDRMRGWRPRAVRQLDERPDRLRLQAELLAQIKSNVVDPQTDAMIARAGETRAFLRHEIVADDVWYGCDLFNKILRPLGIEDRLLGARAVDDVSESYIGLDRGPSDAPFTERERNMLLMFLLGAAQFHREQLLAHGIGPALSPRERQVMAHLLTDATEGQIAQALGLTARSAHQYVVSIARKLGVKGRVGVMAWWLRHRGPGPDGRPPC
jgi:DNA-binding CsgD family transcriptional regulator